MTIEADLVAVLRTAVLAAAPSLGIEDEVQAPELLATKQPEHGDFSTNVALTLAKAAGQPPRDVAERIAGAIPDAPFIERVEVAGPGFLNIFTTDAWLHDALREVIARGEDFGRSAPTGRRVQVEFVSANPTGPLHVGHARNAALGDALARLLHAAGDTVEREYYFNDAGRQMDLFGASVTARYLQVLGGNEAVPEEGYHGSYVEDVAHAIVEEYGAAFADLPEPERGTRLLREGTRRILAGVDRTLDRFGVDFDEYFSERELEAKGEIEAAVQRLRTAGYAYDRDGAVWFRSTAFGDDKDRVLVRSSGLHTYFGADCAYLVDKCSRGFDHLVYVWGADHHGDVVRMKGAAQAMGYDDDALEIVLYQFVSFLRGGEPVTMSKRAGSFISLDELIDEVGADAARFTLLSFSNDSAMTFDIEVVKRQSMDNPVYYVQYGHARIASILRKAEADGIERTPIAGCDLTVLTHAAELALLRALADVPAQIEAAAELRAPHRLTHVVQDVAARFHRFYTDCKVVDPDEPELTQARLWLAAGTKQVIANLLGIVGVSAPESMHRADG